MGKSCFYKDICYLNLVSNEWSRKRFEGIERSNHVALSVGNRYLMIHGGSQGKYRYDNIYWFDSLSDSFMNIAEVDIQFKPSARRYHMCSFVYNYCEMIFYGGETIDGTVDDNIYILDMSNFYTSYIVRWKESKMIQGVKPPPLKFGTLTHHPYKYIYLYIVEVDYHFYLVELIKHIKVLTIKSTSIVPILIIFIIQVNGKYQLKSLVIIIYKEDGDIVQIF